MPTSTERNYLPRQASLKIIEQQQAQPPVWIVSKPTKRCKFSDDNYFDCNNTSSKSKRLSKDIQPCVADHHTSSGIRPLVHCQTIKPLKTSILSSKVHTSWSKSSDISSPRSLSSLHLVNMSEHETNDDSGHLTTDSTIETERKQNENSNSFHDAAFNLETNGLHLNSTLLQHDLDLNHTSNEPGAMDCTKYPQYREIMMLHKHYLEWTVDDVGNWLVLNLFDSYIELFCTQHKIDGKVLVNLSSNDLRSEPLSLTIFGDIKRLDMAFNAVRDFYSNSPNVDNLHKVNENHHQTEKWKSNRKQMKYPSTSHSQTFIKQRHSTITAYGQRPRTTTKMAESSTQSRFINGNMVKSQSFPFHPNSKHPIIRNQESSEDGGGNSDSIDYDSIGATENCDQYNFNANHSDYDNSETDSLSSSSTISNASSSSSDVSSQDSSTSLSNQNSDSCLIPNGTSKHHVQILPTMTTGAQLASMAAYYTSQIPLQPASIQHHQSVLYQHQRLQQQQQPLASHHHASHHHGAHEKHVHTRNKKRSDHGHRHGHHHHHHHRKVEFKPEAWKALIAMIYFFTSTWVTAIVMVIVHDRVPDMDTYPPLPDILLDNLPLIPWAFGMCEFCGLVLFIIWALILTFHKHRFILIRRMFSLFGSVFLLRCVTMLITSLSVPGRHLECKARPYGSWMERIQQAYLIWQGGGMSIQGVRTCGDYMFSGHTVVLTLLNFFITEYTPTGLYLVHTLSWVLNLFGIFFILAAHEHYSIDVFIAFYISTRLFLYYHTLANNRALYQRDRHRTRIWFPLFYFFESSINGIVPNQFEVPFRQLKQRIIVSVTECITNALANMSSKPNLTKHYQHEKAMNHQYVQPLSSSSASSTISNNNNNINNGMKVKTQ
ncbi:hypothetical protein RDWZM_000434 [Blomia tropicalis]|uniref:SAM domain-containing protein n=1 Tax=Blomia tropicalis TaxID=40697 RepID=A0A9Q0RPK4_BLOTA|nr:hypothetical protein RDWZM_000434 [Blomia tropicalis]